MCAALRSQKFLDANQLELKKIEGPASGQSTTVAYTYRLVEASVSQSPPREEATFLKLRGIAKRTFQALGGGEAFIRGEREAWNRSGRQP